MPTSATMEPHDGGDSDSLSTSPTDTLLDTTAISSIAATPPPVQPIPTRMYSSKHYLGFWLLTLAKFLLFLSHNMILALLATVLGDMGAVSAVVLYVFFIVGNLLAAPILRVMGNNPGLLLFCTSIVFTLYTVATFAVVAFYERGDKGDGVGTMVTLAAGTGIAPSTRDHVLRWVFYVTSSAVGITSGLIWVGYGSMNMTLGEAITRMVVRDHCQGVTGHDTDATTITINTTTTTTTNGDNAGDDATHDITIPLERSEDEQSLITVMQPLITGQIMSVGWSIMSFNTVVGGVLAFILLEGWRDGGGGDDNDDNDKDKNNDNAPAHSRLILLFLIFACVSAAANVVYFWLYKWSVHNAENAGFILQDDDDADPDDHENTSGDGTDTHHDSDNKYQQPVDQQPSETTPLVVNTSGTTTPPTTTTTSIICSLYILLHTMQYLAAGMAFTFIISSYNSVTVKETLGAAKAPVVIILANLCVMAGAWLSGCWLASLRSSRLVALCGTLVQAAAPVLAVLIQPQRWDPPQHASFHDRTWVLTWAVILAVSALAGIGDGTASTGLSTAMALSIQQGHHTRHREGKPTAMALVKNVVYSVYSGVKGVGAFLMFGLTIYASFNTQCIVVLGIIGASVVGQFIALILDVDV